MSIAGDLIKELKLEAAVTRKFLSRVPFDKKNFKPSEKSETLSRLAIHVAESVSWWKACMKQDKLDFIDFTPEDFDTSDELLTYFDDLLVEALDALDGVKDKELQEDWSMTYGDQILFTQSKKQVLRIFCMNHLIHHRAQLGVYLRLLDIPVPATYGPSADDEEVILVERY